MTHDDEGSAAAAALFSRTATGFMAGTALPLADTVKRAEGEAVAETVDRTGLHAAQTPQAFAADVLRRALAGAGDAHPSSRGWEPLFALCQEADLPICMHIGGALPRRARRDACELRSVDQEVGGRLAIGSEVPKRWVEVREERIKLLEQGLEAFRAERGDDLVLTVG